MPSIVQHEADQAVSHSGADLQFLDRATGIMDVTYGVAWQLGKSLALSGQLRILPKEHSGHRFTMEQGFARALGCLLVIISRTDIHEAEKVLLRRASAFQSRHETLSDLATQY